MDLLVNELSIHEQFHDWRCFERSLAKVLKMRPVARRFRREIHCNRRLLSSQPLSGLSMQQAVGRLATNEQRSAMTWLTKGGPFWDDLRRHGADDYLEARGDVVTNSAVGEAAYRSFHGVQCGLVSFMPSDWDESPVEVAWRREDEGFEDRTATLANWHTPCALMEGLAAVGTPTESWAELRETCTSRFARLAFSDDSFSALDGTPFAPSAADRIVFLLDILEQRANAFDSTGAPTPESHRLHREYFTGGNSLFSDSSNTEKRQFRNRLTFRHPANPHKSVLCGWHGKERQLTLRLHFTWPIKPDKPVYVVYVGPKLAKR